MKAATQSGPAVRVLLASLAILGLGARGSADQSGEFYTDWDEAGGCTSDRGAGPARIAASGEEIDVCAYPGDFVWISYVAPWCSTSAAQAPHFRAAAQVPLTRTRFVMSLTSGREPFTAATRQDALAWANRYGLDRRMVAAEGHSVRTIPQHALIGPDGRTWYRYIGLLDEDEIYALLADFQNGAREPRRFD